MSDNVYKVTEVVGSSSESQEDAIRNAVRRTAKTVDHVQWFQVTDSRGYIENGDVAYWQVSVKIGFTLED
jgi:flavin-binding protein dodecin